MTQDEYKKIQDFITRKQKENPLRYAGNNKEAYDAGINSIKSYLKSLYLESVKK